MDSISPGYHHRLSASGRSAMPTSDNRHRINNNHNEMSPSSSSYEIWNQFFVSAGIPPVVANDYAVTFAQHRIKIDMLKDITKEILIDMGIKAMGDIIAILRHAKDICAQNELKGSNISISKIVPTQLVATASNNNRTMPNGPTQNQRQINTRLPTLQANQLTAPKQSRAPTSTTTIVAQSSTNRMQSRLVLNSEAFQKSALEKLKDQRDEMSNKRSSSNISNSLAKRMKSSPVRNDPRFTEKTLTVILPTKATRNELSDEAKRNRTNNNINLNRSHASISSRLGPADTSSRVASDITPTLLTSSARSRQNNDLRTSLRSNQTTSQSRPNEHGKSLNNSSLSTRHYEQARNNRQGDKSRHVNNSHKAKHRPKSAIFDRLS